MAFFLRLCVCVHMHMWSDDTAQWIVEEIQSSSHPVLSYWTHTGNAVVINVDKH